MKYRVLIDTGSENSFLVYSKKLNNFKYRMNYKINVKGIGKSKLITHAYLIPSIPK